MDRVYRAKETRKLVLYGILLFGALEVGVIQFFLPAYYSCYLLFIPVYYLLLGISILLLLSRMKRKRLHPGRAIARLMLFNVVQMLLSLILIYYYFYFIEVQKYTILLAFSIFYVFFMAIKMFIIYNIDNQHKTEKRRLQHAEKNK